MGLARAGTLVSKSRRTYFTVSFETPPTWRAMPTYLYPQEQGGPVIPLGTGFPFCRLLRLAGLRWRYSNPPPHGLLYSNSSGPHREHNLLLYAVAELISVGASVIVPNYCHVTLYCLATDIVLSYILWSLSSDGFFLIFYNPILFAICTITYSKLFENLCSGM
jgi:hypothetical protein